MIPSSKPSVKLKDKVPYACKTLIKEIIPPNEIIEVLKSDFSERVGEEGTISQEDLNFLTKLKDKVKHKQDGQLCYALTFQTRETKST